MERTRVNNGQVEEIRQARSWQPPSAGDDREKKNFFFFLRGADVGDDDWSARQ